jgi:hypothetical protein
MAGRASTSSQPTPASTAAAALPLPAAASTAATHQSAFAASKAPPQPTDSARSLWTAAGGAKQGGAARSAISSVAPAGLTAATTVAFSSSKTTDTAMAVAQELFGRANDVDAGLETKSVNANRTKRAKYEHFATVMVSLGYMPGPPRAVSTTSIIAYLYYLCRGCNAPGLEQPQLVPATAFSYRHAILKQARTGLDGWSYTDEGSSATRFSAVEAGLEKQYRKIKIKTGALSAPEMVLMLSGLDDDSPTDEYRRAAILCSYLQGARSGELCTKYLRNVCVDFSYDGAGRPIHMVINTYDTKSWQRGEVKTPQYFSQFHPVTPVAVELDAVLAVHSHMHKYNLFPTDTDKAEYQAFLKRPGKPAEDALPGRPLFGDPVISAALMSTWVKELATQHLTYRADVHTITGKSIRCGMVTELRNSGLAPELVRAQIGHATDSSGNAYYRHGGQAQSVGAAQSAISHAAVATAASMRELFAGASAGGPAAAFALNAQARTDAGHCFAAAADAAAANKVASSAGAVVIRTGAADAGGSLDVVVPAHGAAATRRKADGFRRRAAIRRMMSHSSVSTPSGKPVSRVDSDRRSTTVSAASAAPASGGAGDSRRSGRSRSRGAQ